MPAMLRKMDTGGPFRHVTDLHKLLADLEVGDVITTYESQARVKAVLQSFHKHGQKKFSRVAVVGGFFIRRVS